MQSMTETEQRSTQPRTILWPALAGWLGTVIALAAAGVLKALPPFAIPLVVIASNVALVRTYRKGGAVRAAIDAVPTRWVLSFQAIRAPIGLAFVYFGARGVLPEAWASHAGWGDIAVGVFAVVLARKGATDRSWKRARVLFNALGLIDIVTVVVHAQLVALVAKDPRFVAVAPALPFAMIPYFVVPLVFATHALLIARDRE